jgi:hypothetical protein
LARMSSLNIFLLSYASVRASLADVSSCGLQ